jgi:hypothetical protein
MPGDGKGAGKSGHSCCLFPLAVFTVAPYSLSLLLLSAWWLAWHFTSNPSSLTFGRPNGPLAQNIFFAAIVPPIVFLACIVAPNLIDGVRHPSLFRSRSAHLAFVFGVVLFSALVLVTGWFLIPRLFFSR